MDTAIILIVAISFILIGLFNIIFDLRRINKKHTFSLDYLEKYSNYIKSDGSDEESYEWLTLKAEKMQDQLGSAGIMNYKMPGSMTFIPNYPIVINLLPEIRRELSSDYIISKDNFNFTINTLRESILRYIGLLEDLREDILRKLKNPLVWFREGVKMILLLPLSILNQFGLFSNKFYYNLKKSLFFKITSSFIALTAFVSSIFTIALGWEKFYDMIKNIF